MAEKTSPKHYSASPYSTGGGGVRLEHRVGAVFLAHMLAEKPVSDLGDRPPTSVAFQQSTSTAVDDLVLTARSADVGTSTRLEVAVRRTPRFIRSDQKTADLISALVRADLAAEDADDPLVEVRLAVVVVGHQTHAQQLAELATVARGQPGSVEFFALVNEPGKFSTQVRGRLGHVCDMVAAALTTIDDEEPGTAEHRCWALLARTSILRMNLDPSDAADWTELLADLMPIVRGHSPEGAVSLRGRLEALAGEFAQTAAAVDARMLRRRLHGEIDSTVHTPPTGWTQLLELDQEARTSVAREMVTPRLEPDLVLPRAEIRAAIVVAIRKASDLMVKGDSGVGKSALVLDATEPGVLGGNFEALALNLRHLPTTQLALRSQLGSPFRDVLAEMSAPHRILLIDGAEAAAEEHGEVFAHLLRSARRAEVKVVAVAATDGASVAIEWMKVGNKALCEFEVPQLTDEEIAVTSQHLPCLQRLADDPRGRELLRRPIVAELLSRAGDSGVPLSESEALDHIWRNLVRNGDRRDAGDPDAREDAMLRLAGYALRKDGASDPIPHLDSAAIHGLRLSGLLQPASGLPWERVPEFRHDLIRSYSVARLLLADRDPAGALLDAGAPRWALPAARLACAIVLSAPVESRHPVAGRVVNLQTGFDGIAAAGNGERWADVPSEALLSMSNPGTVLRDAWDTLLTDNAKGLARAVRILHGRHQRKGFVDPLTAEPLVTELLGNQVPQALSDDVARLLRDWLRSHIVEGTPAGQPTRKELCRSIVTRCGDLEQELLEKDAADEAVRAARTPQEVAADEAHEKKRAGLPSIPVGRRRRRPEPERHRPFQWIQKAQIEHLALLGPDLDSDGEAILRRIAEDEPQSLDHAVEPMLAGHGLAAYDPKLLADLAGAYYIDEEEDDEYGFGRSGLHDEGIRPHRFHGGFASPLFSYLHGPFVALFRADFLAGVALLNQMLNHAALRRVRIISNLGSGPPATEDAEGTRHKLAITGELREYVGDGQVWRWYRGTGVGPYPCMSALQALELGLEEFVTAGVPVSRLVPILMTGAESLAMPALVLGLLVRHLESAEDAIDPFLTEPLVWSLEFSRAVGEQSSGPAAQVPNLKNSERRGWNLREVCTWLNLSSEGDRLDQLMQLGEQLVAKATAEIGEDSSRGAREYLAAVQRWAATLDRSAYDIQYQDGRIIVQQFENPEIDAVLEETNAELRRKNTAAGLLVRHAYVRDNGGRAPDISEEELAADIAAARDLLVQPPQAGPGPDGPVATAASVVELALSGRVQVSPEDLEWGARILLEVAAGVAQHPHDVGDGSFFSQGTDRSAARALPFLLLPNASGLVGLIANDPIEGVDELVALSRAVAARSSNEARLAYGRALDAVWSAPCDTAHLSGRCHHQVALDLVEASFVDSVLGPFDIHTQRRTVAPLDPPTAESLETVDGRQIILSSLTPALRATGSAAVSGCCIRADAAGILDVLLAAHQRGKSANEHGSLHSQSESLVAARAALFQALVGVDGPILKYVDRYLTNPRLLSEGLGAIAAAGDERADTAQQVGRLWPQIMDRVLASVEGQQIFFAGTWGEYAEAALIPNPSSAFHYLAIEMNGDPYPWRDLLAWTPQVERWLESIGSSRMSIDQLVIGIRELDASHQVAEGLTWIETIVGSAGKNATNTFMLPEWLRERRVDLTTDDQRARWRRIVDLLMVAGDERVADLAD